MIVSSKAPAAGGAYSQAIRVGNLVFLAGQLAVEVLVHELSFGAVAIDPPRLLTVYHATCGLRYAGAGAQLPTSSVVGLGTTELPLG